MRPSVRRATVDGGREVRDEASELPLALLYLQLRPVERRPHVLVQTPGGDVRDRRARYEGRVNRSPLPRVRDSVRVVVDRRRVKLPDQTVVDEHVPDRDEK